eukprot:2631215-Ditylum_brightwellii.AAC.1
MHGNGNIGKAWDILVSYQDATIKINKDRWHCVLMHIYLDSKHDLQMISRGRQDLVLETKVANMEIKMGIMEGKGGNYGQGRNK